MIRITLLVLLSCSCLQAQDSLSYISLKLQSRIIGHFHSYNELDLEGIIPAILFENSRNQLHQIEIFALGAGGKYGDRDVENENFGNFRLGAAYEFFIPLNYLKKYEEWKSYLAWGSAMTINSFIYEPNNSNSFSQRGTTFARTPIWFFR